MINIIDSVIIALFIIALYVSALLIYEAGFIAGIYSNVFFDAPKEKPKPTLVIDNDA